MSGWTCVRPCQSAADDFEGSNCAGSARPFGLKGARPRVWGQILRGAHGRTGRISDLNSNVKVKSASKGAGDWCVVCCRSARLTLSTGAIFGDGKTIGEVPASSEVSDRYFRVDLRLPLQYMSRLPLRDHRKICRSLGSLAFFPSRPPPLH